VRLRTVSADALRGLVIGAHRYGIAKRKKRKAQRA
jgi:hypothetical protein